MAPGEAPAREAYRAWDTARVLLEAGDIDPALVEFHVIEAWVALARARGGNVESREALAEFWKGQEWVPIRDRDRSRWLSGLANADPAPAELALGLEWLRLTLADADKGWTAPRGPPSRHALWAGLSIVGVIGAGILWSKAPTTRPWRVTYHSAPDFAGEQIVVNRDRVAFRWGLDAPLPGMPADDFSVTAETCLHLLEPASLQLDVAADDGARVFVDGTLAVDAWADAQITSSVDRIDLGPGSHYLRVEYHEGIDDGELRVGLLASNDTPISGGQVRLSNPGEPSDERPPCGVAQERAVSESGPWVGEFFTTPDLSGASVSRTYETIAHDWGEDAPIPGFPADLFSARFSSCLELDTEEPVTFVVESDDGARVYVDRNLVVDNWKQRGKLGGTWTPVPGRHLIEVEHYDSTSHAELHLRLYQGAGPVPPRRLTLPDVRDGKVCGRPLPLETPPNPLPGPDATETQGEEMPP